MVSHRDFRHICMTLCIDTLCNAGHSDGGGGSGMKWRRNDDDERNLIEYDSLAFQAENGKFPA